jgi:lipid-A-disaccharide synthase
MKYYIISGEASGDLHGSNLIKELKKLDSDIDLRFWGGDLMQKQGGKLVKHYKDLAFMGFTQVLMNLRTIIKNISFCKKDILEYKPDVIILIDYPGFNLRIAEFAKQNNIKVFYYISPQIWAWKQSRVHKIKKFVDEMFVILPFEKDFYKKFDFDVTFVGHPLLDAIEENKKIDFNKDKFRLENNLDERPIISILAGSRKQEVKAKLPIMLSVINDFPDYQFVIAGAPSLEEDYYKTFIDGENIKLIENKTYDLLKISEAAIVTSGTATLETALFEVPEVVCYKTNNISYFLAKKLIKVKYISLVNLIMDKEIIKELIQFDLNKNMLKTELNRLLNDTEYKTTLKNNYTILKEKLGGFGASKRLSLLIFNMLKSH